LIGFCKQGILRDTNPIRIPFDEITRDRGVMPVIQIGERKIGKGYPPLVIAEIGINHGGSLEEACKMVDAAQQSGVEIVKHQTHVVEDEMSREAKKVIPGNSKDSIYQIISECALSEKDERKLKDYVESKNMIFLSTPFSRAAANRLENMGVLAYKIGSGECNNYPLIEHIARFGKPIILSTGMNSIESVRKAVKILERYSIPYALLHTTNLYPTPHHLVRLGAMTQLAFEFPNAVIGLSDHTIDNYACLGAVALGASILERHFTDSLDRPGPDIANSMDPNQCRELITASKIISLEIGGTKDALPEEQVTMNFAFATVVTIKPIAKGELLSEANVWVKRPGTGEIVAERFHELLGRKATHSLEEDIHLKLDDVEWQ